MRIVSAFLKFVSGLLVLAVLLCVFIASLFSNESQSIEQTVVSNQDVLLAKQQAYNVYNQFLSYDRHLYVSLTQQQLDAIAIVGSHTLPFAKADFDFTDEGLLGKGVIEIDWLAKPYYLNASCLLGSEEGKTSISWCRLGYVTLPRAVVETTIFGMVRLFTDEQTVLTAKEFIGDARITSNSATFQALKRDSFRDEMKSNATWIANTLKSMRFEPEVEQKKIQHYLSVLDERPQKDRSLSTYIGFVMAEAAAKTADNSDPIVENTAALWALAIKYGNIRFSQLVGFDNPPNFKRPISTTLHGRRDLALHFLYSVILEQLGRDKVALNVGVLKELLDTNSGGSGFSFVDLAADKAGLRFSDYMNDSAKSASQMQKVLANQSDESIFFPAIEGLPENLSEAEFKKNIGSIDSPVFKRLVDTIDKRINALPLYKK